MARRVALCALCALAFCVAPETFLGPARRVSVFEMGPAVALIPWMQGMEEAEAASTTTYNFDPSMMPSQYSAFGPERSSSASLYLSLSCVLRCFLGQEAAQDNEALLNFFLGSIFFGLFAAQVWVSDFRSMTQVAGRYKDDK